MNVSSAKPNLGLFGVFGRAVNSREAKEIETMGYGAVWVGGSPSALLDWADPILGSTTTLHVASGIVNIWTGEAGTVAESFHRLDEAYPGRFLLGIGGGHPEVDKLYRSPLVALNEFLDKLDQYGVPRSRRILAAVGPKMLQLGAARTIGVHPYLTTPQHTAATRATFGPDLFIAPEHKVVVSTDAGHARADARHYLGKYLHLSTAARNFKTQGFTDADIAPPGSDRLVDAFAFHGTAADIATKLTQHLTVGADHVPIQVISTPDKLLPALAELAGPLGIG